MGEAVGRAQRALSNAGTTHPGAPNEAVIVPLQTPAAGNRTARRNR